MSINASIPLVPDTADTEARLSPLDPPAPADLGRARVTPFPFPAGEAEEAPAPRPGVAALPTPPLTLRYFDELKRAMEFLARDPRVLFLGQAVAYPGTAMSNTLKNVPLAKLLEVPVDEEMQMGMTNGLALAGLIPVSIFPRWNFLLLAVNQIVNHLDKFALMSNGGYQPRVIIRTGIGSERPLHPQHQHVGDYTEAFRLMCPRIDVIRLEEPAEIFPAYQKALERTDGKSTLIVEYGDYHSEK
jgi:pyruvate/2-oxoglutarate/acetoin dehydrogenase E1 component